MSCFSFCRGVLVIACLTLSHALASAATINVDINAPAAGGTGTYSGPGASPDTGTFWNGVNVANRGVAVGTFTSGALTESNGATVASGVTFSVSQGTGYDSTQDSAVNGFAPALLDDFVYPGSPSGFAALTINGLVAGNSYDLFVYTQNGGANSDQTELTLVGSAINPRTTVPVGGDTSRFVSTFSNTSGGIDFYNGNYIEFSSVVATGGSIQVVFHNLTGNGAVDGFQITGTFPTPEPSSLMLLGLGVAGLMVFVRRRRKA